MYRFEILSPEDIELVHARSLEILERLGIRIDSVKTLEMLDSKGCIVDFDEQTARFPSALVEEALAAAPKTFTLGGLDPEHNLEMGVGNSYMCSDGQGCFTHDLSTNERRASTIQDLIDSSKIIDEMDYFGCNWPTVTAIDVPDGSRTIHELVEMWRVSSKHIQHDCFNEKQAAFYIELLDLLVGRERVVKESPLSLCCCPITPLQFEGPMVEGTIAAGAANIPVMVFPMPITGMTSPMSLFSAVIQNNAEVLAGLTIFELAHPGRPCIYAAAACDMDMRSNACLEGSAEGLLINTASIQIAKQRYHLPTMGAMATDAYVPGSQTGTERALNALSYFAVGSDLLSGTGLTCSSMCLRFDELVYDEDIVGVCRLLAEGIHGGEKNALTDDLYEQGIGGNFLMVESTLEYLRNGEHYQPRHYRRESYESWKAEGFPDPMEEAAGKAREIIAHHDKNNYSPELSAKLDDLVKRADAELTEE